MLIEKINRFFKRVCYVVLLATAFSLSGCSSEDMPEVDSPNSGDPVLFSVATLSTNSRTHYGEPNGNKIPIYWNQNDQINIYSNLASTSDGSNYSTYWVNHVYSDGEHKNHAQISAFPDSTKALRWTDLSREYTFLGAYPIGRIKGCTDLTGANPKLSMDYHTNQFCEVSLIKDTTSTNRNYKGEPDMQNAYMMARKSLSPSNKDHILLAFDPIMTTLRVHITGGKYELGTGIIQSVRVSGISVLLPHYLEGGKLEYQLMENTDNGPNSNNRLTNVSIGGNETVYIGIKRKLEGNCPENYYVEMLEGDHLDLMAFLPPMDGMEKAVLRVHTLEGYMFEKTLNRNIVKQGFVDIKLPDITPQKIVKKNWISKLPPNKCVFDMSFSAFDFKNLDKNQSPAEELRKLLDKGVRVFDVTPYVKTSWGNTTLNEDVANVLKTFIAGNSGEFVWIIYTNVYGNLNNLEKYLNNDFKGTWANCPDKTTTISNVKGKLVVAEYWQNGIHKVGDKNDAAPQFEHSKDPWSPEPKPIFSLYYNEGKDQNWETATAKVAANSSSTGTFGIVMMNDVSSKVDLFVQSLIDFNFKSRISK